ncbi:hypothetical protein GCM10010371_46750 [Streptomyces subrutilus]|uniref:Uncharacterized protein n=2 Tax=Streptomyces subrutilus TaxID=36818 RepID=A0A5P2UUF1_9ACTN|nr:hypothetical protein CP968_33500 [Streptomyces subrutilus]GGZ81789.1 hypothetical protein GCM10010371_46750 [Streptomyces subrutilus]
MRNRDEKAERADEPVLTTEDLARPGIHAERAADPRIDRGAEHEAGREARWVPGTEGGHATDPATDPALGRESGPHAGLQNDPDAGLGQGVDQGVDPYRQPEPGTGPGAGADADAAVFPGEATRDLDGPGRNGTGRTADGGPPGDGGRPEGTGTGAVTGAHAGDTDGEPLLGAAEAESYRTTWSEIQGRFVDDPREAVRSADTLVAEVMQAFAGTLAEHRSRLEKQWDSGEEVATEDLRLALRAYRSLVNRLLDT